MPSGRGGREEGIDEEEEREEVLEGEGARRGRRERGIGVVGVLQS